MKHYLSTAGFVTFLVVLLIGVCAGGCEGAGNVPPDGCACEDDGDPCTTEACVDDACESGSVVPGEACVGVPGFCDSDGVCREKCPARPCFDSTVEIGFGCVYEVRPNGWTCTTEDGSTGVCRDEICDTNEPG